MSDIRFNQWLHQSGTGGVSQSDGGHVGIGTTNPLIPVGAGNTHILNVGVVTCNNISAGSSITATTFYGSGANLTGIDATKIITGNTQVQTIDTGSDGHIKFTTEGSERLRITSDGRIGINDSTPNDYEVDIKKRSTATDAVIRLYNNATASNNDTIMRYSIAGTSASNYIYFGDGDDSNSGQIRYQHSNDSMQFTAAASERLRIDSSGHIGIGTDNPSTSLQGAWNKALVISAGTSNGSMIRFIESSSAAGGTNTGLLVGQHSNNSYIVNYQNGFMSLRTNNAERFRIGDSGQLGIGGATYGSSGQVLTSQGSGSAPVWANAGITMADQWRITSSSTLPGAVSLLSSNWSRVGSPSGYGNIGSAMSESSGAFTFPSTGVYLIQFTILLAATSAQRYLGHRVQTSINNFSSAQTVAEELGHMALSNSFGAYHTSSSSYIFDVTNTSTHKIRFAAVAFTPSDTSVIGNSNQNSTFVSFIRLGDT